jgi:nucleoside phosphorylase
MIVCAGESESFDFAKPIGIGLIESAINLTKICIKEKPSSIIFVGTAGSYGKKDIFEVVTSSTASNIENSFFTGDSYTPIDNVLSMNKEIRKDQDVSHETIVNSSNYITTSKKLSKEYLNQSISIENMEFYSVLRVAQEFDIPVKGIFVVTNYCDENAHDNFIKNHDKAKKMIEELYYEKHL